MSNPVNGDDATTLAQANLLRQPAQTPASTSALPVSPQQPELLSADAEKILRQYFKAVPITQADLSFQYDSFGRDPQGNPHPNTGGVTLARDANNRMGAYAAVNSDQIPLQSTSFGLIPAGAIDSNNRATPNSLLDAVAAQEISQKIIQTNPKLQGMSKANEELIGEGAMLAVMPESYSRTFLRSSLALNQTGKTDYDTIAAQTVSSTDKALQSQPGLNIKGEDLVRNLVPYINQNGGTYSDRLFNNYLTNAGIQDPAAFREALKNTISQDFQTAGRQLINNQAQINQPAQTTPPGSQPQTMAPEPDRADITVAGAPGNRLYEQAYAGVKTIGNEKLGLKSDQEAMNVAAALTKEGVGQNINQFAMVVPGGNGKVFGLDSDPQTNPGHKHVNVDVALVATLPVERSSADVQKLLQQQPTLEQPSQQREPRSMGMA